jgi:cytochrome c oxidase cbb3-type subunit 4
VDAGTWHGLLTLAAMAGFVAIALWAYSGARKAEFERAARAPLDDDAASKAPSTTKEARGE